MGHTRVTGMKFFYLLIVFIIFSACTNASRNNQVNISSNTVILSGRENMNPENSMPVLSYLTLDEPENLNILHTETFIRVLRIRGGNFLDLNPLMNLRFLEELYIDSSYVDDISPLSTLSNLKRLYLTSYVPGDLDLSPIAELTNLEELYLSINNYDITPLSTLVNLRKLELQGITRYVGILPFSELVSLQELRLSYYDANKTFSDLLPLQQLEVLHILAIDPVELDISNIVQLHSLKELTISSARRDFKMKNIYGILNLTDLEVLEIQHNGKIELSFVLSLKNLHTLGIRHSIINDVSPLLYLPNLVNLSFLNSKIKDLSPLLNSPSIRKITGHMYDDDYAYSPVYRKFEEQGVEFWSVYDN
jgi:Leucine-rich repeat (LRR) protein